MAISKIKSKKYGYTYQVDVRYKDINGVTQRLIKSGFKDRNEAVLFEAEIKVKAKNHEPIVIATKKTIEDVYKEYLQMEVKGRLARTSQMNIENQFQVLVKEKFHKREFAKQTNVLIQHFFCKMEKKYNYPTLKNIRTLLINVYTYGQKVGYIHHNPARLIHLNRNIDLESEKSIISDEEFHKLLDRVLIIDPKYPRKKEAEFTNHNYRMALIIARYTGLRISEVVALEKTDFDLENKRLSIKRRLEHKDLKREDMHMTETLKSQQSKKTVEIGDKLVNELKKWFDYHSYELVVCTPKGDYIKPNSMEKKLANIAKEMNINFTFHTLRHTYATELMMSGANPLVVKELMRHSRVQTTWDYYTHAQREDQRKALDDFYESEEHAPKLEIKF